MIKTCPICNRQFESIIANATYCNLSCRKKAGREKEKEKRSAFYEPPKTADETVLWSVTQPSLEQLEALALMLTHFVRVTKAFRGIMIYGRLPDGCDEIPDVQVLEQYGARPKCWAMTSLLPTEKAVTSALLTMPVGEGPRAAVANALQVVDIEVENVISDLESVEKLLEHLESNPIDPKTMTQEQRFAYLKRQMEASLPPVDLTGL